MIDVEGSKKARESDRARERERESIRERDPFIPISTLTKTDADDGTDRNHFVSNHSENV
jgi:hypothetical protein